jgi:hypothetical protein
VVFGASLETTHETGIAQWGFGTDAQGVAIFHGYDSKNNLLVEIRQTFDAFTKQYSMKITGPLGPGSVALTYIAVWSDATQSTSYLPRLTENTLAPDSLGARVLQHLAPDAAAIPINAPLAHGGRSKRARSLSTTRCRS